MEWHRRLDQEEAEVLQLERILLDYNNVHVQQRQDQQQQQQQNENVAIQERNPNQTKMEKKLREIDRSLRELSSISGADGSTDAACVQGSGEFVRTSGTKLNKLWRRLTSQRIEKFLPNKKYKLCKADVEQLYEDAKLAVLHDFGENAGQMEVFLGQTSIISTPQPSSHSMEIPQLNLNFSSGGQSEEDIMMRGNYSPSAAEEGFHVPSTSSRDGLSDESNSKRRGGTSRNSSSSALHSMPEGYSSSSSSQRRFDNDDESKTNKFKNTSSDVDSKSVFSTKSANVSKLSINYVLSSKNDVDQRVSGTESTKNDNKIDNSVNSQTLKFSTKNENVPNESLSSQIGTISTKTSLSLPSKSDIPEILEEDNTQSHQIDSQIDGNSSLSRRSTKPREILSNIEENVISTAPELTSNAAESIETLNRVNESTIDSEVAFSTNSRSSQIYSSYSANANENVSQFIESTKTGVSTASNLQSQLEHIEKSVLKTQTSDITDGNVTSLIASISKCSKNSSDIVPITETTNQSESASNIKTPSESLKKSSIKSQTLNTASSTKSEDNVSIETKPTTNSQTESRSSKTEIEEMAQTSNNQEKTPPTTNESRKSSEECATVSILKSLLNSTYNSNSIFISNQASNTASDIQAQLRTNGHDFSNWSNTTKEDSHSSKDEQQSIATQVSDETTLKSIKSIDNSTNSKHSIEDHPSPTPVSKSASEGDIIHHSNQQTHNDSKSAEDNNYQSYSSAFEEDSSSSTNQIRSSVMSIKSPSSHQIESEPLTNAFYESDFTEGEETNIDDISLPKFESTGEEEQFNESQLEETAVNSTDFEKRLIDLDVSLKDLDATFEKALSPEKTLSPPRDDGSSKRNQQQQNESALMPDIISEVELRRRHQAMLENELKQFEHAVPYMYVREIPNKPPPPYVPPAHGSPMTTIFPSEERIKDITFRRTKELYYEILNIDTKDENGIKPPSVLDENITNIYERIILDICKEYLTEYKPILTSADPNNFHSSLAFFNPPDRVKCMQEFIYKEVRKNLAMDKNTTEKSQLYSVYGHRGKRDHIGEIIIQEMFEEDNIWSNFYIEEEEVLELIIDEMIGSTVRDICIRVLEDEVPRDSITPTADVGDGDESVEMRCNNST